MLFIEGSPCQLNGVSWGRCLWLQLRRAKFFVAKSSRELTTKGAKSRKGIRSRPGVDVHSSHDASILCK